MFAHLEAVASHDLPLETKVVAQISMKQEMENTLGPEQIVREAKQLADSIIKIDQGFERIKIELGRIDSGHFRGQPIEQLQPQISIDGVHKCFISFIWRSNRVTRQTGAYVKEFVNVILPTLEDFKSHAEYKEVAADLREFAMRKNPFELDLAVDAKGERHSLSFTELQYDIKSFRDNFELFIEEQGIELEGDIVCLQEEISDLVWQMKRFVFKELAEFEDDISFQPSCKTLISILSINLGVAVCPSEIRESSVAAISALALVCPISSLVQLSGVLDAVPEYVEVASFISKTNGFIGEISHYQSQLNERNARLSAPELIQVILRSQGNAFDDVCGRIDQLSAIWSLVAHDATLIVSDLEHAYQTRDDGRAHKAFLTRVRLVRITYGVLAGLLKEYARQIERHSFRFGQTAFKQD
ncbi:hypothetical protein J132_09191 [Termitomyces sp. J132]|nr:hypothetical protein J132_09191 [Termitomyces sp. J132]